MGDTQQPQPAGTGATGAEAAAELAEIQRRQEQVIKAVLVPVWYWWVMAAAIVAIGAARDSGNLVVQAIVIPLAVLVMVVLIVATIPAVRRRVQVNSATQPDGRAAAAIIGMIVLVDGVTISLAVSLAAAHVPYPGHHRLRRRGCRARDHRAAGEPVPAQAHAAARPGSRSATRRRPEAAPHEHGSFR